MAATTRKIDLKRRLVITPYFAPGDVVKVETEGADVLIVTRLQKPERVRARPRLTKGRDGKLVFVGGPPVNADVVKKLLEDFP